ncbi:hypothetical protein LFM09_45150 [Lentzea alba]|uniref:hypothetical protein n=1 Tax=Lentzea alba TaxID=2714351 RepID=UPI0039BFC815
MLMRTAVGAVVGTVVGGGFLLTLSVFTRWCNGGPFRTGCGGGFSLTFGPIFSFWLVVAGVLIYAGFRVTRAERWWWVIGIGGGLWFVLFLALIYVRMFHVDNMVQADVHDFMATAYVILPCAAFAVAALCTGRRRAC